MLASGAPDFPFALCWANEPWTRAWDGLTSEVLVAQEYSDEDDRRHIRHLLPAFADPRYVRVDGRPLFLVYKASQLPDPRRTTDRWREEAARAGIGDLYLCRVEHDREQGDPAALGFDAAVDFQPDFSHLGPRPAPERPGPGAAPPPPDQPGVPAAPDLRLPVPWSSGCRPARRSPTSGSRASRRAGTTPPAGSARGSSCGTPHPRRTSGGSGDASTAFVPFGPGEDLVFLNAWNEWAEGNHLEPCLRWGHGYLEATRRALSGG